MSNYGIIEPISDGVGFYYVRDGNDWLATFNTREEAAEHIRKLRDAEIRKDGLYISPAGDGYFVMKGNRVVGVFKSRFDAYARMHKLRMELSERYYVDTKSTSPGSFYVRDRTGGSGSWLSSFDNLGEAFEYAEALNKDDDKHKNVPVKSTLVGPKPKVAAPEFPTPWTVENGQGGKVIRDADGEWIGNMYAKDGSYSEELAQVVVDAVNEVYGE